MMAGYEQRPQSRPPQQHATPRPDPYRQQQQHRPSQGYGGGGYNQHPPPQQHYSSPPPQQGHYSSSPPQQGHYSSPPPQQGHYTSPPLQQGYGQGQRPPPVSRPPPTPAPPAGADPTLYPLFKAVDKDGSGQLSEKELRAALVNGDWTSFDPHTVRMMIRMFDTDRSGTIGFEEFCGLWGFLAAWRALFDRFDTDRSGNISFQEFQNALSGVPLSLSGSRNREEMRLTGLIENSIRVQTIPSVRPGSVPELR
jgi:Ca2+-binding EF-hand superfamily protein